MSNPAIMAKPFVYRLSGRRPMTLVGLILCLAIVVVGLSGDAPWIVLAPVGAAAMMLLVSIVLNPVYGLRIDRHALEIDRNGKVQRFPLDDIDHVRITRWTDSDDVMIHLAEGGREPIPQMMRPESSKLREILERYAVKVIAD
jgi:hypothetical protein